VCRLIGLLAVLAVLGVLLVWQSTGGFANVNWLPTSE
jgi:hypothetical protein